MIRRRELARAAALAAAAPAGAASTPAKGRLSTVRLRSTHVPAEVAVSVYLPPGDPGSAKPYPLLLLLHGGGGSEADLARLARPEARRGPAGPTHRSAPRPKLVIRLHPA